MLNGTFKSPRMHAAFSVPDESALGPACRDDCLFRTDGNTSGDCHNQVAHAIKLEMWNSGSGVVVVVVSLGYATESNTI